MSLLIESIKIFNGRIFNLQRHEDRIRRSREELFQLKKSPLRLRNYIEIPDNLKIGLVKCRVVYGESIKEITYSRYHRKSIKSLKLVSDNSIDYHCKFQDRSHINDLYAQRGDCDDIIIVKDGMLTDCSYSNLALLKDGKWFTPIDCLLRGTRRQQLIDQGRLAEKKIVVEDLQEYDCVSLINAMMGLGHLKILTEQIDW